MNNVIVTHCDRFHCDEVFSVSLISDMFGITNICRTRDEEDIKEYRKGEGNYIVDVGKVYDVETRQFDHHQAKVVDTFEGDSSLVPLSSFGLVWKAYGKGYIRMLAGDISDQLINSIYRQFYYSFVIAIDANDNGLSQIKEEYNNTEIYNYRQQYTLPQLVAEHNTDDTSNHEKQMVAFLGAVSMCKNILGLALKSNIKKETQYYDTVEPFKYVLATRVRKDILFLEEKMDVDRLLREFDPKQEIKLIVVKQSDNDWRIWTVAEKGKRFKHLVSVAPHKYLENYVKTPENIKFVHATGFTGGAVDSETALHMAYASIIYHDEINTPSIELSC